MHGHLVVVNAGQKIDRDVWVVSFDVQGLPWLGGPYGDPPAVERVTKWWLAFVDAEAGEFVFGLGAGGPK